MSSKINEAALAAEKIEMRLRKKAAADEPAFGGYETHPTAPTEAKADANNAAKATAHESSPKIGAADKSAAGKATKSKAATDIAPRGKLGKKQKAAIIGASAVACALLLFFLLRPAEIEEPSIPRGTIRGTVVTEDNVEAIREWMQTPPEDAYYTASMNTDWVFTRWNVPSANAFVENVTLNTRTVYFDLFLDETEELIYSSPFIPVGGRLDGITLDQELPAGVHAATVVYVLVDDDHNELSTVSVAIKLTILG